MYYGSFIIALALVIVVEIIGINSKKRKILRRISFGLAVLCSVIVIAVGFSFSLMYVSPEKTYEEPETTIATVVQLKTLKNTNYYLVKDGDTYRYYPEKIIRGELIDNIGSEDAPKVAISKCKVQCGDAIPKLFIWETKKQWRKEWLFLYDSGTETEIKYNFIVPDEKNILNLNP